MFSSNENKFLTANRDAKEIVRRFPNLAVFGVYIPSAA
jgi:hypothetical protein